MNNIFQIVRYGSVGILMNILGYFMYLLLANFIGFSPVSSAIISGLSATVLSYGLHRKFSFKSTIHGIKPFLSFFSLYATAVLIHSIIIWFFSSLMDYRHELVALISLIFISIALFLIQRNFIFKRKN